MNTDPGGKRRATSSDSTHEAHRNRGNRQTVADDAWRVQQCHDVAKYFDIIPAAFATTYPALNALNVMRLATPQSAVLSAVIFNALIIIALIPLALKGITYRSIGAGPLLRRHLLIYGLGGVVVPFVGIKLIDLILVALHLT